MDAKDSSSTVSRIKATHKLKEMLIDLKKDLDRLKDTLTRQTKTKGEHSPSEESISVKKETLKNI